MVGGAGEADQRVVAAGPGVDALGVSSGHIRPDLDLCLDHADRLGVRAADGPPGALALRRFSALVLPELDDLGQQFVDMWIDGLDLGGVTDELG